MLRSTPDKNFLLAVDKPAGMTSFDVVHACRKAFHEKRIGHIGTLDPAATGVLIVLVGCATRLNRFLANQDKTYSVDFVFGFATDTDDECGTITKTAPIPKCFATWDFANKFISTLPGRSEQVPPAYSAVKVNGKKSCDEARRGNAVTLAPRAIEIYSAELIDVRKSPDEPVVRWRVNLHVSKGTYVRAIVRDAGERLGCPAHAKSICRTKVGSIGIQECVSLDDLKKASSVRSIDPLRMLDMPYAALDSEIARIVSVGGSIDSGLMERLCFYESTYLGAANSGEPCSLHDGEFVALLSKEKLVAIYSYVSLTDSLRAQCVFPTGVNRGGTLST